MTDKQIVEKEKESASASPAKSLLADLMQLRRTLRVTGRAYLLHLEAELDEIVLWAKARAVTGDLAKAEIRDLGDMVTLVRKIEVKPQKGRRKDLKKIDATIGELRQLLDQRRSRKALGDGQPSA